MRYQEFERIISAERMSRYFEACGGNTRKAMTLYKYNIELSQVMFAIICHFEVALRNAIDSILRVSFGNEWLKDSAQAGGLFDTPETQKEFLSIGHAYRNLLSSNNYSHEGLLACMGFGFWKYRYSPLQYRMTGRTLLRVFPDKPRSTAQVQYNHTYIFNELDKINTLRNRIAHHEPICFTTHEATIYTNYILNEYQKINLLFRWMGINSADLLSGLDHVRPIFAKIERLKPA